MEPPIVGKNYQIYNMGPIREDIYPGLKQIFYLFDEYCKNNGIFYDIVSDEPLRQGYTVDRKHSKSLYDYILPNAERNKILVNCDNQPGTTYFIFTVDAIKDDGHWELYNPKKRTTIFANNKDSESVQKGTALGMAGYKYKKSKTRNSQFNQIHAPEICGNSIPANKEPGTNSIGLISANRSNTSGENKEVRPYNQRINAYDLSSKKPFEDVFRLQNYRRTIQERFNCPLPKLGRPQFDPTLTTNTRPLPGPPKSVFDSSKAVPDPSDSHHSGEIPNEGGNGNTAPNSASGIATFLPANHFKNDIHHDEREAQEIVEPINGPGPVENMSMKENPIVNIGMAGVRSQTPTGDSGPISNVSNQQLTAFQQPRINKLPPVKPKNVKYIDKFPFVNSS